MQPDHEFARDDTNHDEPYVISQERLAEIRLLIAPPWEQTVSEVVSRAGVTVYQLAAAVEDLLAERDDRGDNS